MVWLKVCLLFFLICNFKFKNFGVTFLWPFFSSPSLFWLLFSPVFSGFFFIIILYVLSLVLVLVLVVLLCYCVILFLFCILHTMLSLMYLVSVLCVMRIINSKLWMMYNNVCNDKTLYVRGSCKPKKRLRRNKMKKKGRREGGRIEFKDG